MNWRQIRWGVDGFAALVVVSVGVALAGLTWHLAGYSGATPPASPIAVLADDPADIAGLAAMTPFGAPQAASDAAGDGTLHLKGILLAMPASASSALITGSDGKVVSYGIGAPLGSGVIEAIQADQVILRTPRGLQTVTFPVSVSGPPAPAPGGGAAGAGFAAVGAGVPSASSGVPATGTPSGFRIGNSGPPALLAAGLLPGDLVQTVNGAPVDAGTSADAALHRLAAAALHGGGVPVVVLRNGKLVSLLVAIH